MRTPLILAAFLLPLAAQAFNPNGLQFSHNDWELACDNTGTCRAAGYYDESEADMAISILLTRQPGPQTSVSAQVMLGEYGENPVLAKLPAKFNLTMKVNGKPYGQVAIGKDSLVADLAPNQVSALLAALPHRANIEFTGKHETWRVSDKGAAAVLLKMDEYQGRLGTPGALARKGKTPETTVPGATPAPVITMAPYAKARPGDERFAQTHKKALLEALRATVKDQNCDDLASASEAEPDLAAERLDASHMLVSTRCWLAAYNFGSGYWVVNHTPPFNPMLVSTDISDASQGELRESQKGRGLGDCWSSRAYTWDGRQFRLSEASTSGMCRLMAAGGAWSLPTFVSKGR